MVRFIIVVLILIAISAYGWKALSTSKSVPKDQIDISVEKNTVNDLPAEPVTQNVESVNNKLYKLKGSIDQIVNDSVQEEIQQAVQEEISKSQGSN